MKPSSWLVFLYGPPAVGKLTIARELQAITQYRLFHNHLVVDLLESVFEFGSEPFRDLRELIWLSTFREAARRNLSLIFTFAPERTVRPGFPAAAEYMVRSEGGRSFFVSLHCPDAELQRRVSDPSRASFNKLHSAEQYRKLRDAGTFDFPQLRADLEIDTNAVAPAVAARQIADSLLS